MRYTRINGWEFALCLHRFHMPQLCATEPLVFCCSASWMTTERHIWRTRSAQRALWLKEEKKKELNRTCVTHSYFFFASCGFQYSNNGEAYTNMTVSKNEVHPMLRERCIALLNVQNCFITIASVQLFANAIKKLFDASSTKFIVISGYVQEWREALWIYYGKQKSFRKPYKAGEVN